MTQVAAIAKALLAGETLSIMNGYHLFHCTNLPREISRSIEKKFDVEITKLKVDFTSKYGQSGYYFTYRLNPLKGNNNEGIKKMINYLMKENAIEKTGNKTSTTERFEPFY